MNNINLSIIIPHFELPDALDKLLSTIPDRDDVEVIVVDDKSKRYLDRLQEVKEKYSRPSVIFTVNQKEKGAGNSRNTGLEMAHGDFILFADTDDYFLENMYDKVCPYFDKEYDVIAFMPTSTYMETGEEASRHREACSVYRRFLDDPSVKNELRARYQIKTPWSKLIRRDMVLEHDVRFDNTRVANDVFFSAASNYYCRKFKVDEASIYCVTDRKNSLTKAYDYDTLKVRMEVFVKRYKFLEKNLGKAEFRSLKLSGLDYYLVSLKFGLGMKAVKKEAAFFKENNVKRIYWSELFKLIRPSSIKRVKKEA